MNSFDENDNSQVVSMVQFQVGLFAASIVNGQYVFKDKKFTDNDNFISSCTQYEPFLHTCEFSIVNLEPNQAGTYNGEYSLKYYPDIKINLNITVIKPKQPDITIIRPRNICTLNYTCELNSIAEFQCLAQAHDINRIGMIAFECKSMEDCFNLRRNNIINDTINEFIVRGDENTIFKQKERVLYNLKVKINQPYLLVCFAINDVGERQGNVIVLPSELENGRTSRMQFIGARKNDSQIVEGDTLSLRFDYNNQLFSEDVKVIRPQTGRCIINERIENAAYTRSIIYEFKDISDSCTHNYSFTVMPKNHPYLANNKTARQNFYYINIERPLAPSFAGLNFNYTNNQTVIEHNDTHIDYFKIYSDGDQTLTLDCKSNGRPAPTVEWLINSTKLNLTADKYTFSDNMQTLRIVRTHASDSGVYECFVKNRIGQTKRTFDIFVKAHVIYSKKLSVKQKVGIGFLIASAVTFLILLIIAVTYAIWKKRAHDALKVYLIYIKNAINMLISFCYFLFLKRLNIENY